MDDNIKNELINSCNNSSNNSENFHEIRKNLNEPNNLFGPVEKNKVLFNRKYVANVLQNKTKLFYTNIKATSVDNVVQIANLCIIHGFGHYSQEFYEMAYNLAKRGVNCHLIDLRGNGLSAGRRFDWTIEELHSDILTLIKQAENESPELPLYIFGHSFGGGLLTSLFINNQYLKVNGIILSSPLLGYSTNVTHEASKLFFINKFGNNLKDLMCHGHISPGDLCKDEKEIVRIINDKLMLPVATPRSFRGMFKQSERILENSR